MNTVNYQETIVIPTLQKKLQELQINNLFLEVSLLVEQAKTKDIENYYKNQIGHVDSIKNELDQKNNRITELKTQISLINSENTSKDALIQKLENDLKRETSVRESIHTEYNTLKGKHDVLAAQVEAYQTSINNKKTKDKQA
jgi:chromosome segregation ATPase